MKRSLLLRSLLVVAAVAAAAAPLLLVSQRRADAAVRAVIVQLSGDPVVVARHRAESAGQTFDAEGHRRQIVAEQNEFLGRLGAKGVAFSVVGVDAPNGPAGEVSRIEFRFDHVYNGVTLAVPDAAVALIEAMPGVKSVHRDMGTQLHLDNAVKYVRARELYGNPPQVKLGDSLQTEGFHGEGVYIAVVDTGVDWAHPMFGGDPTPPRFGVGPAVAAVGHNQKVPYYLNLTAGAVQDDFGHGTHVAGIAAGYLANAPGPDGLPLTADDVSLHGVAPQAKIMGYKVLSTVGSGAAASIIMAVEDAVQPFTVTGHPKPVAHVINLSLGNTSNDPNYPTSVACDNATLAGTTVVASAGNSGAATATNPTGEGTIGSPGSGRRVLTVGANIDPGSAPNRLDEVGGREAMKAFPLDGGAPITSDVTNNYVYCGLAETPDQVPDSVSGKIALIARGGSVNTPDGAPVAAGTGLFSNKAAFALAKGAVAVVIYNNVDGELTSATVRKSTVPVVGISKANGEYLKAAIGSDAFGAVSANQIRLNKSLLFEPAMADFSSKGWVGGFGMVKPDVTAPGVSVLSATVRVGGVAANTSMMFDPTGYISASGTSMSSPMTAGVAALVKQKNPSWTPSMIRAALMNTATNLRHGDGSPVADGAQTVNQQGAGLVDAAAAAGAKALLGTGVPAPTGSAPAARPNNICPNYGGSPSPLCAASPGNPDFLASHSFGAVPIAGVEGAATLTQTVSIFDIRGGAGAGTYEFFVNGVRGVDDSEVRVSITHADGRPAPSVEVPAGGGASVNVSVTVSGARLADPTQIEFYLTAFREDAGQTLRMPFYLRAVKPALAAAAPTMGDVAGAEVADATPVDIDGAYRLQFAKPSAGDQPAKLRVQESADGGATWAALADVDASQTSYEVAGRANGSYQYRAVALYTVQYGLAAGPESGARAVRVERRVEQDVTSAVQASIVDGTVSFSGGVAQFDQVLRNASASSLYAPLKFVVTSVQSGSGRVAVSNADNGGTGAAGSPAAFDYSATFGPDLAPNEASAAKRLRFTNPGNEMFQFTAVVYAHLPDPAFAPAPSSSGGDSSGGSSGSSGGSGASAPGANSTVGTAGALVKGVLRVTYNPLLRTVRVELLK